MAVNMDCFVLPGVDPVRAASWCALGQRLGLDDFNPTTVNWDKPFVFQDDDGSGGTSVISKGTGYAVELCFGAFFTVLTMGLTMLEKKYGGVEMTSEHYNTAGRNVKTGLTASVIVSQWTWAATLLQSSNVAWQYGVSGPFWYASGASIQVLLFGIIAIEIKRKAPNCHTFLELVDVRWGKSAHYTFMFFGLATNVIVSSMLMLGGTATMEAAAGIDIRVSGVLIPLGVVAYTYFGGLKATFLASYVHTTIIFIILVIFVTVVYGVPGVDECPPGGECTSLGSASIVYERLRFMNALPERFGIFCGRTAEFINNPAAVANDTATFECDGFTEVSAPEYEFTRSKFHQGPATLGNKDVVNFNRGGSYLTMMSLDGLQFGIINVIGNFGTVFLDQSYWQSAIAASPASSTKGYLLGGLAWFTIPFALATSLGLAGNALNVAISPADAGGGLVPMASARALMGQGGALLVIIQLFMAITSTASAESIAVAGLWSYDIYRKYINPNASGEEIRKQSQFVVAVWSFLMIWFNWILWGMDLNLGWVYNFMGIMIGSGVFPVAYCILWSKTPAMAAIGSAWIGMVCGVITWLVTAASLYDKVNKDTTGSLYPQLAGNCVSFFLSGLICTIWSLVAPQNYDFAEMNKKLTLVEQEARTLGADWESTPEFLEESYWWIVKYGGGYTIFLIICWPCMSIPWGVFSESIYNLWASVAFGWGYVASFVIILTPIYENWSTILRVLTMKPLTPEEKENMKAISTTASKGYAPGEMESSAA